MLWLILGCFAAALVYQLNAALTKAVNDAFDDVAYGLDPTLPHDFEVFHSTLNSEGAQHDHA